MPRRTGLVGSALALASGLALAVASPARADDASALRERLAGTWRLVSVEDRGADGAPVTSTVVWERAR